MRMQEIQTPMANRYFVVFQLDWAFAQRKAA